MKKTENVNKCDYNEIPDFQDNATQALNKCIKKLSAMNSKLVKQNEELRKKIKNLGS